MASHQSSGRCSAAPWSPSSNSTGSNSPSTYSPSMVNTEVFGPDVPRSMVRTCSLTGSSDHPHDDGRSALRDDTELGAPGTPGDPTPPGCRRVMIHSKFSCCFTTSRGAQCAAWRGTQRHAGRVARWLVVGAVLVMVDRMRRDRPGPGGRAGLPGGRGRRRSGRRSRPNRELRAPPSAADPDAPARRGRSRSGRVALARR